MTRSTPGMFKGFSPRSRHDLVSFWMSVGRKVSRVFPSHTNVGTLQLSAVTRPVGPVHHSMVSHTVGFLLVACNTAVQLTL